MQSDMQILFSFFSLKNVAGRSISTLCQSNTSKTITSSQLLLLCPFFVGVPFAYILVYILKYCCPTA